AVALGVVDVLERDGLGDQAEDEGHDRLAGLGLLGVGLGRVQGLDAVPLLLLPLVALLLVQRGVGVAGVGLGADVRAGAGEAELRHAHAVVPGLDAVVVEAARLVELEVEEALAAVVLEGLGERLLDRLLAVGADEELERV